MLSFVVPAYNSERTLDRCLDSILRQDLGERAEEVEVIVVDNASTDATAEIARRHVVASAAGAAASDTKVSVCSVRLMREERPGAASTRNRGIAEARGGRIALVDADCELPRDWAQKALAALEEHPGYCAVGGPGKLPPSSRLARSLNALHYGVASDSPRRSVRSLATMNALFDGEILRRFPFDPDCFWAEDAELNLRLVRAGHRLLYDPALEVVHHHPTTLRGIFRKWYGYGLQYPVPYLRKGQLLADPGFLPRLLYLPIIGALAITGLWFRQAWIAAVLVLLALPAVYALVGWRSVRGGDRLFFPVLHAGKQLSQMAGMVAGTLFPRLRAPREK